MQKQHTETMETTTIIYFVALVAVFIAGVFVGRIVNVNSKVADKRREYEDRIAELSKGWGEDEEHAEWHYERSSSELISYLKYRDWLLWKKGALKDTGFGSIKVTDYDFNRLMRLFRYIHRLGLRMVLLEISDEDIEKDPTVADKQLQEYAFKIYPHKFGLGNW